MAAPASADEFLDLVRKSGVVDEKRLDTYVQQLRASGSMPDEPGKLAGYMVRDGLLTHFQAEQFLLGKWRRFTIGKYKVLERLGSGGMGSVYLCEHKFMRRRVAVKVLPAAKAEDPSSLERFYREARAAAALDHPNIVRAYDIDQDENLHFLVMEYVDGASLQEIIKKTGPMPVLRAAHYIRQSAIGLQHAHEAGLVHRDIKPGNLLVDRTGIVKVLDMGLARFFHDEEDILTKKYDESVLGTADYLAPEQALDSHGVDIRADIYSLGATFYFCLTGQPPFNEGTVAQKLIWHQTRQPKPIRTLRPEVPEQLAAVIGKMMEKDKAKRYQTPAEVAEALAPLTTRPIPPPPEVEMPRLSPAASMPAVAEVSVGAAAPAPAGPAARPVMPAAAPVMPAAAPVARVAAQPVAAMPQPAARSQANQPTPDPRRVATPPPRPQQQSTMPPRPPAPTSPAVPVATPNWSELVPDRPAPRSGTTVGPAGGQFKDKLLADIKRRPRFWAMMGGGVLLALALLIITLKVVLGGKISPAKSPTAPSSRRVSVSPSGDFRTVRDALAKAMPGDRIVVQEPLHEEQLDIRNVKDIVIEADPNLGKLVVWRPPPVSRDGPQLNQLLTIANCENVTLKGFLISGQNNPIQTQDAITLFSRCSGVKLEDLRFEKFRRSAVHLINVNGEAGRPVVLRGLWVEQPLRPEAAALLVDVQENYDPPAMEYVLVENCRLDGPFRAGVQVAVEPRCKKAALELRGNRVFGNKTGTALAVVRSAKGPGRLQLTAESNTFFDLATGLDFQVLPPTDEKHPSRLTLANNLFVKVQHVLQVKEDPALVPERGPKEAPANWIWFNEGDPAANAPVGDVFFRSPVFDMPKGFTDAVVNITADDSFALHVNGQHVANGADLKRVFACEVTKFLQPAGNVITVKGRNETGPAGLLVQLVCTVRGKSEHQTVLVSDGTWKASREGTMGWRGPAFKETEKWLPARVIAQYGKGFANNLTWDFVVRNLVAASIRKIASPAAGNWRDAGSQEGNVTVQPAVAEVKDLNLDPRSEQFLRYPKTSPLATAGAEKKPVGAPPG